MGQEVKHEPSNKNPELHYRHLIVVEPGTTLQLLHWEGQETQ